MISLQSFNWSSSFCLVRLKLMFIFISCRIGRTKCKASPSFVGKDQRSALTEYQVCTHSPLLQLFFCSGQVVLKWFKKCKIRKCKNDRNKYNFFSLKFTYFLRMLRMNKRRFWKFFTLKEIARLYITDYSGLPSILMGYKAFYNIWYPTEYFLLPLTP